MTTACGSRRLFRFASFVGLFLLAASPLPMHAASDDVDVLVDRMDARWARRTEHGAMVDVTALGTLVLAMDPGNFEATWRLARAYFFIGYTQPNRLLKRAMTGKAAEWASRAMAAQPERVEGHYYYAVSVGEYATTIGITQALREGVAGKVESAAERAYALGRDFDHGGPMALLGRYYYMLPWPMRDLPRSRRYLEELRDRQPRALLGRCYLADTYYDLGEKPRARAELEFVLQADPLPGTELDIPAPKPLAREALQRWFPGARLASGAAAGGR